VRVHVAFTPAEAITAPTAVVLDVLRATSTIAQALTAGYQRVFCCAESDDARALRETKGSGVLAGERGCVRIPGFDLGNSPQEFLVPRDGAVILSTTNGTRALVAAAATSERVLAGSLLNLGAIARRVSELGDDVTIVCAGVLGELALDDVYCAGRLVEVLGGEPTDGADAAMRLRRSFGDAHAGLAASQSARNLVAAGLESDIAFCARESVLDVVPQVVAVHRTAVEVAAA
jgi:2-phosphosulfolactate phosphatase